jgi:hypothetical protein
MTWFRAGKDVYWLSGFGSDEAIKRQAMEYVRSSPNSVA